MSRPLYENNLILCFIHVINFQFVQCKELSPTKIISNPDASNVISLRVRSSFGTKAWMQNNNLLISLDLVYLTWGVFTLKKPFKGLANNRSFSILVNSGTFKMTLGMVVPFALLSSPFLCNWRRKSKIWLTVV